MIAVSAMSLVSPKPRPCTPPRLCLELGSTQHSSHLWLIHDVMYSFSRAERNRSTPSMAEKAEAYVERSIPELDELIKLKIISDETAKSILKKRRKLSYGIFASSITPPVARYEEIIAFEESNEVERREAVSAAGHERDQLEHEGAGLARIYSLYERAVFQHPRDEAQWVRYIDFAQRTGADSRLSAIFGESVSKNPHSELLWTLMAAWSYHMTGELKEARTTLLNARRLNPNSSAIVTHLIKLHLTHYIAVGRELEKADSDEERGELEGERETALADALTIFTTAIAELPPDAAEEVVVSVIPLCPQKLLDAVLEAADDECVNTAVDVIVAIHKSGLLAGSSWSEASPAILEAFEDADDEEVGPALTRLWTAISELGLDSMGVLASVANLTLESDFTREVAAQFIVARCDEVGLDPAEVISGSPLEKTTAGQALVNAESIDSAETYEALAAALAKPVDPVDALKTAIGVLTDDEVELSGDPATLLAAVRAVAFPMATTAPREALVAAANSIWVSLSRVAPAAVLAEVKALPTFAGPGTVLALVDRVPPTEAAGIVEAALRIDGNIPELWLGLVRLAVQSGQYSSVYDRAQRAMTPRAAARFELLFSDFLSTL
ncbi:U3 small nucleolar RNA-associated protein 6 [Carpediemonas membranifera]|uniref:U3 small nucleolar RNA-associated protein 6 n=1 Tax=Carpediemonas membranifera TaxID=201153 RepID=A0A8J6B1H5_9EUKA|nr:U3 small nucleolar RNA-associated protein 6 [Carpediemonas membranifera]|eukprot:KAG9397280.1 U3 small nucleolar RNA-associated protein 6 [Carpediemonas membranifera]